jgi:hypothetical protein
MDIVSDLAFGKSLDMLTSPKHRFITEVICGYIKRSYIAMQYPWLFCPGSNWLSADTWLFPRLLEERARYLAATKYIVKDRIEREDNSRQDIMSHLLKAKEPDTGETLSFEEIWSEAYLMISAGKPMPSPYLILASRVASLEQSPIKVTSCRIWLEVACPTRASRRCTWTVFWA